MLLQQFQNFVKEKHLVQNSDKLLLAASGGVDSMVLLDLCLKSGFTFEVAHVNFKLREADSDADEAIVMHSCKTNNIPFYSTNFDTLAYAKKNKISIQMAARDLRYGYFNRLMNEHDFTKLVTAHHANDSVETFFINLLRSSGIEGLTGIPTVNEKTIRPLLFAEKSSIENYAKEQNIQFNTDVSNLKDDYLRNHLRHHVIPALQNTSSNAVSQVLKSMQHLQNENKVLQELLEISFEKIAGTHPQGIELSLQLLKAYVHFETMLFMYLKNYGFTYSQVQNMLEDAPQRTGSVFYSNTHQVVFNRESLILSPLETDDQCSEIIIHDIHQSIVTPIPLSIKVLSIENTNFKNAHVNEAYLDAAKIQFPLSLRKWQHGDTMFPLGMKHQKKISDILIDSKIDVLSKEKIFVLCNANGEIIWLVGHRVSENFKVESSSNKVYNFCIDKI